MIAEPLLRASARRRSILTACALALCAALQSAAADSDYATYRSAANISPEGDEERSIIDSGRAVGARSRATAIAEIHPVKTEVAEVAHDERVDVRLDAAEAEAALAILESAGRGEPASDADWQRLFSTEGYRRLKRREAAMGRAFEDASFRDFLTSPDNVARAPALRQALKDWSAMSIDEAAQRALAYLPAKASIRATIFFLIKPQTNSFVFDLPDDPAIALYLDPSQSAAKTANTIAHELHHVGFGGACPPSRDASPETPAPLARLALWIGGYGEGFAMLAAAGGGDKDPHAQSSPEERARWRVDVGNLARDMADQERFFRRVLDGELTDTDEIDREARRYYGVQGPWYTVGWSMAREIEYAFGRQSLIDAMCGQTGVLKRYNAAVAKTGSGAPLWSDEVANGLAAIHP